MQFRRLKYYRHKNYRDVFVQILGQPYPCHQGVKLKVQYMNFGCDGIPFLMPGPKHIGIKTEEYPDWVEVTDITKRPDLNPF